MAAGGEGVTWRDLEGKAVRVRVAEGSGAASRADGELREADAVVEALALLLDPPAEKRAGRIDLYLIDPVAPEDGAEPSLRAGDQGIVRVIRPEAPEPLARALVRFLVARWFGPGAAEAGPILDGLAGVASARAGNGPTVEEAHAAVRAQLTQGLPVSVLGTTPPGEAPGGPPGPPPGGGGPPPGMPPGGGPPAGFPPGMEGPGSSSAGDPTGAAAPASPLLLATSFVSYLIEEHGEEPLRRFLRAYDPSRRDQASMDAYQRPLGSLEEAWLGKLREQSEPGGVKEFLRHLVPLFKPYWARQIEAFVYLILGAFFAVISMPVALGAVIGALGGSGSLEERPTGLLAKLLANVQEWLNSGDLFRNLMIFILILLGVYVLEALLSLRRSVLQETISQRLLMSLQEKTFVHLQRLPHSFYATANVGDLMMRLSGDVQTASMAMTQILDIGLFTLFSLVMAVLGVITLNPILGLLVLVVVPFFLLTYKVLGSRLGKASYEQMVRGGEAAAVTQEALSAHAVVKAFGLEHRMAASYRARLNGILKASLKMVRISSLYEASSNIAITIGQLIVIGYGGYLVINDRLGLGALVAFLGLLPSLLAPLSQFSDIGQMLKMATGSLTRVMELLGRKLDIEDASGATELAPLSHEIKLENVTFAYDDGRPILENFSMTIPAGSSAAIVGPSGSGKSTVINLLMRFFDPQEGRVLFDGKDAREVTVASLRGQTGLVFQETFIFDTTVRENIAIGRPDATDEEVAAAARAAQLDGWVEALPQRYDTVLGERGVRMSGGQRQRLAIARVLLRNPRIMLLDEATSALDAATEADIRVTLEEAAKGRTTVTITHRLVLASNSDLIFVIDGGRLVEQGTHAELSTAGGLYQRLHETQMQYATGGAVATGVEPERLRSIPLLAELPADALDALAGQLRLERYGPGQDVIRQGEAGDKLFLIGRGRAEVLVSPGERRVGVLEEGEFFGEMALVSGAARAASVRTLSAAEVFSLTRDDFRALMDRHPEVREAVSAVVSRRSAALEAAVAAVGAAPAPA